MKARRRALCKSIALAAVFTLSAGAFTGCAVERQRVVEERRTMAFDMYNDGEKYERAGDYNKALESYLGALQLNERPAFLYKAGRMHHLMGNPERASIYYDRALELQPGFELALTHRELARLELAEPETATRPAPREIAAPVATPAKPERTPRPARTPAPTAAPRERRATPTPTPTSAPSPISSEPDSTPAPAVASATPTPAPALAATPVPPIAEPTPGPAPATPAPRNARTTPATTTTPAPRTQRLRTENSQPPAPAKSAGTAYERIDETELRGVLFPELNESAPDPAATRRLATEASESGRWAEAVLAWNRVIAADPNDVAAHLALARAYQQTNRLRRALEVYEQASQLAPNDPEVEFQWGNALVAANDHQNAEPHYKRAIELHPQHLRARNNLAALHMELGRYNQAIEQLRTLLAESPEFGAAHLNLARSIDASGGNLAEAIEHLETYLRLEGEGVDQVEQYLVSLRARRAAQP